MLTNLEKLLESFPKDIDCALIVSPENRRYFTSMKSSAGSLVVTKDDAYFLVDFRYYEKAKTVCKDCEVILTDSSEDALKNILQKHNVKHAAVESKWMSLHKYLSYQEKYEGIDWVHSSVLDDCIEQLRIVKSSGEISCIQAAQDITDAAFLHILNYIEIGKTEQDIALELEYFMRKQGAEAIAFDTIAVSGKNSSLPHGVPGEKPLLNGDFLTMDFGAVVQGYHSDMTRTVALGEISEQMRHVYNTVLQAQLMAIDAIRPGAECAAIDAVARGHIDQSGYQGKFGHSLGHGVGIEIHESPNFAPHCNTLLQPGMVVTVEPGIYIEDTYGVRIEDMIVVTEDGCNNFTKSSKDLLQL